MAKKHQASSNPLRKPTCSAALSAESGPDSLIRHLFRAAMHNCIRPGRRKGQAASAHGLMRRSGCRVFGGHETVPRVNLGSCKPKRHVSDSHLQGAIFKAASKPRSSRGGFTLSKIPDRLHTCMMGQSIRGSIAAYQCSIASSSSMKPAIMSSPLFQKAGSLASRPKGASSALWCFDPPASSISKYLVSNPSGASCQAA